MIVNVAPQFICIALTLLTTSVLAAVETKGRVMSGRPAVGLMGEKATRRGEHLAGDNTIADLVRHPAFAGFGHLLLPWDDRTPDDNVRLRDIGSLLPYHSDVDPAAVDVGAERRRLSALFHEDAVFVHMGGTMSRSQELEVIKNGGIHYRQADIQEVSVKIIGTTAILLNRIRLVAVVGGSEVTNPFVVTEVYVQQGGTWKLVHRTVSSLCY